MSLIIIYCLIFFAIFRFSSGVYVYFLFSLSSLSVFGLVYCCIRDIIHKIGYYYNVGHFCLSVHIDKKEWMVAVGICNRKGYKSAENNHNKSFPSAYVSKADGNALHTSSRG